MYISLGTVECITMAAKVLIIEAFLVFWVHHILISLDYISQLS